MTRNGKAVHWAGRGKREEGSGELRDGFVNGLEATFAVGEARGA